MFIDSIVYNFEITTDVIRVIKNCDEQALG